MRSSLFLKPVAYLQPPTCSRLFFTLPSFPVPRFGSSDSSKKGNVWRRNASVGDEDDPEGNEDGVQGYHERKIMPCVAIKRSCYGSTVLTRRF